MYAIVDIAGQQLKVEKYQKVFVHRLDAEEGSKVNFDKVLLVDNDGKVDVGIPTVKNIVVSATVVGHLKGDKVKVFKKKRRKGYQTLNGHRQYLTEILINDIASGKATSKSVSNKEEKQAATKAEEEPTVKEVTKKETAAKATSKETAPKKSKSKPAAKKNDKKEE